LVAWSLFFVEGWRQRERVLAVRWGTYRVNTVSRKRTQFKGTATVKDPLTGEATRAQPWWLKDVRAITSLPVILFFGTILSLLISAIFTLEVILNEVYRGPGKQYLSLLPTVLFAGLVPQVGPSISANAIA